MSHGKKYAGLGCALALFIILACLLRNEFIWNEPFAIGCNKSDFLRLAKDRNYHVSPMTWNIQNQTCYLAFVKVGRLVIREYTYKVTFDGDVVIKIAISDNTRTL